MDRTDRIARAHELPRAPPPAQMSGNRAALLGWRIVEALEGRSRMEWTPTPELANPVGGKLRARGTATFGTDADELTMADGRPLRDLSASDAIE
jgi:hypothetical protein